MASTRKDHDYFLALLRYPAEWLAWVLAKTPITPNMVTIGNFIIFVPIIIWLFIRGSYVDQLLALVLIAITILFDLVDGSLARRRGIASQYGYFLDTILDNIFHSALLVVIVGSVFIQSGDTTLLWWGLAMLFGQNMANIWGGIYSYEFQFNGYSGNRSFTERFTQESSKSWSDRLIKNAIVPTNYLAIIFMTARIWIIVGVLTNHLAWMLVGFGVMINVRWLIMGLTYLRLTWLTEQHTPPRWTALRLLQEYWVKKP